MADDTVVPLFSGGYSQEDLAQNQKSFQQAVSDELMVGVVSDIQAAVADRDDAIGVYCMVVCRNMDNSCNVLSPTLYTDDTALALTLGQMRMAEQMLLDEADHHRTKGVLEDGQE